MLNKRGSIKAQLTIFIIIVILIIAVVALFFVFKGRLQIPGRISPEIAPITGFVQECLDETAKNGIFEIAKQGGYYNVPEPKMKFSYFEVPYYWYVNKNLFPKKEVLENELSEYTEKNLQNCTNNFSSFKQGGYNIKESRVNIKTAFLENKIVIKSNYPLEINKGDSNYRLNELKIEVSPAFYRDYLVVEKIIEEQEKNPDSVPIGFISDLAYKENFNFDTINIDEGILYILVFDQNSEEEIYYYFASKYGLEA